MTRSRRSTGGPSGTERYLRRRRFGRECALQFLYQLDANPGMRVSDTDLTAFWQQVSDSDNSLTDAELEATRPFAEQLILGVCAQRAALDERLRSYAQNWTLERMSVIDRNILRLAAFEMLHCDEIPAITSIDEAVELAKAYGDSSSPRFVNGILDRLRQDLGPAEPDAAPQI